MIKYFIIFTFILLLNCSFNESKQEVSKINLEQGKVSETKKYSFEEYVNLLSNENKPKEYPDINNFPD